MDKLRRAKALLNVINDKKGIGVFTLNGEQWFHLGQPLSEDEKKKAASRFEKVIEIQPVIITKST